MSEIVVATDWELVLGTHELTLNPSWQEIHAALVRMDGTTFDQVGINRIGIDGLFVGGGNDNHYTVIYHSERLGESSLTLTDPSANGPDVAIHIRTLESYPVRHNVGLPMVLEVFSFFFQEGKIPQHLTWEPEHDTPYPTP